jgi:MRC1-like domain
MADAPESASFNLDAILSEFNGGSEPALRQPADDAVARVRESFGLGRSIFRRKEPRNEESRGPRPSPDNAAVSHGIESKENDAPRASRPVRRIVETDDEDDLLPVGRPRPRSSSSSFYVSVEDRTEPAPNSDFDSDHDLSTEKFLEDYRMSRAKALAELNAKAASVHQEDKQSQEDEVSIVSDRSHSPAPFASRAPQKTKTRKASRKAVEEMHKETQRMARNMGLRPEVKVTKKIEMSTIYAKFGFNPTKTNQETHPIAINESEKSEPEDIQAMSTDKPYKTDNPPVLTPVSALPARFATPNLDDSDSDESLPTPSKLLSYLSQMPTKPPTHPLPTSKLSSPRKVHFTLPPSPSTSDEDSDVEIVPPPNLLTTHATTPDRKKIKRSAFIRSLAGVKSPGQLRKSPGRMTTKELDATLSREAAVQAKRKRDERRAELKSLGIDLEKIVEKRDLLEEAREEARRVRQEEGGDDESDDDAYLDEGGENDGDDEESGGESGESIDDVEEPTDSDDEAESEGEDETEADLVQDVRKMRRGRKHRINSDDEDSPQSQETVIPESTAGSHNTSLPRVPPVADLSLTQFFQPTQISGAQQIDSSRAPAIDNESTGLTQFFQSTAIEPEVMDFDEGVAHGQMELLRQQAARTHMNIGDIPATLAEAVVAQRFRPASDAASPIVSPVQRRILKRRTKQRGKSTVDETSGEFLQSRKEFIEEQAEESEDDYKAWGSGDESDSENVDGVVEGLIDDETKVKRNAEEEVARLYMFVSELRL